MKTNFEKLITHSNTGPSNTNVGPGGKSNTKTGVGPVLFPDLHIDAQYNQTSVKLP
jgi:hypothetical protein